MQQDTHITEMIFRIDNNENFIDRLIAIMPYEVELNGSVTVYQHVGQHSSGDYNHMIATSRPANEFEIADLKAELTSLGYNVKVAKKRNYDKYLKAYYQTRDTYMANK